MMWYVPQLRPAATTRHLRFLASKPFCCTPPWYTSWRWEICGMCNSLGQALWLLPAARGRKQAPYRLKVCCGPVALHLDGHVSFINLCSECIVSHPAVPISSA